MRTLPMLTTKPARSYVVYRGPSRYTGEPIVAILTGTANDSANTKTGAMAQLWILNATEAPSEAQNTGADRAVCGECPMRPKMVREARANGADPHDTPRCYVRMLRGPNSTWKANRDTAVDLEGAIQALQANPRMLRFGAYGDPAALPLALVEALSEAVNGRTTGYTHAWAHPQAQELAPYLMASVGNEAQARLAWSLGWRTFRTMPKGAQAMTPLEAVCPFATGKVQCADCGMCNGMPDASNRRKSITIEVH